MRIRGITYDSGFVAGGRVSHEVDHTALSLEMAIIRDVLHCDAVRVTGGDPARIDAVAQAAAAAGLEVWVAPFTYDLTQDALRALLVDCAHRAERLRAGGARVVLVLGAELSLFTRGFLPGDTAAERTALLADPAKLRAELPHVPTRINAFLRSAIDAVKPHFRGPLTYAAIGFEGVDWTRFDFAGFDMYRTKEIAARFPALIEALVTSTPRPVVMTEYGCATFRGAADVGARAALLLRYDEETGAPLPMAAPAPARDEEEQAACIGALIETFERAGVDAAFLCTFSLPALPRNTADPTRDFDAASYAIVSRGGPEDGRRFPGVPWAPKRAFDVVAAAYGRARRGAPTT